MEDILTHNQLDLIWNIEVSCRRCIQGACYFNALPTSKDRRWAFTQNSFGAISILFWCQVFGSDSEPTHYSKLFAGGTRLPFKREDVAIRLRQAVSLNKSEYKAFWQGIKAARDKFFVHNEFNTEDRPLFPDLHLMTKVCLEMRIVLREILEACTSEDEKYHRRIVHWISHFTNEVFLRDVEQDIPQLQKEASKR